MNAHRVHHQVRKMFSLFALTCLLSLNSGAVQRVWAAPESAAERLDATASSYGGSWFTQTSNTIQDLYDVHFLNANRGWAVGNGGTIRVTGNGGATWESQPSGVTVALRGVHFVDANLGWIVGDLGTILHTTNGGASWVPQTSNTTEFLQGVDFVDDLHGWVVGNNSTIRFTDDGGAHWYTQVPPSGFTFMLGYEVDFWDQTHGWIAPWAGNPGGGMLATDNGGTTWSNPSTNGVYYMTGVSFINATEGWAAGYVVGDSSCPGLVGYRTRTFHTSDGGNTWTEGGNLCGYSGKIDFIDATRGWLTVNDLTNTSIVASFDGGKSWKQQYAGSGSLTSIEILDARTGWAVGFNGSILHYIPKAGGAATTGVFRPGNGLLYLKNKNETGIADIAINYGIGGDYPVVGDWDGNGSVTIGVYRHGSFYLRNSNTAGFADMVFAFGIPGDQPVAGDWDGDGTDTIGVYRPSTGQFLLRNSNSAGVAELSFYLGNVGDVGIAGDWDGDGLDTTGVFRPGNGMIFLKTTNTTGFADAALNYGIPGDKPVTGDWNNDGIDTIGVYRNGQFLLRNSNTVGFADLSFGLGNPGDIPIAGDWDGLAPILQNLIERAKEDLAQRLPIALIQMGLVRARAVIWPDTSLGCPQPGYGYAQVLVPGYLIVLTANDSEFEYHADWGSRVFYCENPHPPVPGISGR